MVLLAARDFASGLGLDIHIRTKARYSYSYIEAAAIRIGEDVLEVGSFGQYFVNGVEDAELPFDMGDGKYPLTADHINKKKSVFEIKISEKEFIKVHVHKDMVNVEVSSSQATKANFGTSVGMMGRYPDGALLARDGTTIIDDHDLFGQEWQVDKTENGDLFQSPSPYTNQCLPPNLVEQDRRRLGQQTISEDAAAAVCEKYASDETKKQMCVFDVIAMDDLEAADVHGVY